MQNDKQSRGYGLQNIEDEIQKSTYDSFYYRG